MTFEYSTIEEQFQKLPEEVQYALTSPHISEQIMEIAEKNGLLLDQMEVLYDITTYVMLGLLPSDRYTSTLARELNVSEKQAGTITEEINSVVFVNIRNAMRQFEEQTKRQEFNETPSPKPENKFPINNDSKPYSHPSPHADLEQAGNFKIETESSLDNNISLKSPPKKTAFVTEQQMTSQNSKMADLAMLTPTQNNNQNPPQVSLQSSKQQPAQQVEQHSETINVTSPEKPTEQPIEQTEMTPLQTPIPEQKVETTVPTTLNPVISSPVTPTQELPTTQTDNASKMQAFDPKNFYNFGNIEEQTGMQKSDEISKDIDETKNTEKSKSDTETASNKNIFSKTASQIHFEKGMKNKNSKISASSQIYQPKVQENVIVEKPATPKDNAEQIQSEKENTALIDELIAHPTIKESVPANIPYQPAVETEPIPETTKEEPVVTENKKTPSMEEIRSDIRSKVSEYNPTTTWADPIQQKPKPIITETTNKVDDTPKEQPSTATVQPKTTIPQPPINRPKGFDPYREPIQ